ncbi:hypothetical protein [Halorubrum halodurans]|uniref:Uncharacterized protein n=1 Tax=Halorubrum halodurans TaxID=1383851 RepID=A0A256ICD4_9EURY|nr:hypothetical protein [Halorubrum halodurans]OYR53797.1 hypothetical protein DJ70_15700 [Halorubrum halodurans]
MAGQTERDPNELGGDASDESHGFGGADGPEWLGRTWYRSGVGIAIAVGDLLLTVVLVAAATVTYDGSFAGAADLSPGLVPPYVPVFSLLGALGFVFTTLIERFDGSAGRLLRYNVHLLAALPLGVGVFLLSDIVLAETATDDALVAGTVFLSGLYVNLAYKRLGALARRLLPGGRSGRSSADEGDDGNSSTNGDRGRSGE